MKKSFNVVVAATFCIVAVPALAQDSHSLDLTVNHVGVSIGDSRRVTGLRINFRDRYLDEMNGVNITMWQPYRDARGEVHGIAVGLPLTGARRIDGLAVGIFGVSADDRIRGISLGGIGMGAGNDIEGIAIGGIGMGVGRDLKGLAIGGIGMGVGNDLRGVGIGGIGLGVGQDVEGAVIGGIGGGAGGNLTGLAVGGIGVGVGGSGKGILIGGVGAGVGNDFEGLSVAGIGIGAGNQLKVGPGSVLVEFRPVRAGPRGGTDAGRGRGAPGGRGS